VVIRSRLFAFLAFGAVAGFTVARSHALRAASSEGPTVIEAAINLKDAGSSIARSFLGLSIEYGPTVSNMVSSGHGHRRSLEGMLNEWGRFNGPPVLRIGGNSEDMAAWNLPALRHPRPGVTIDITPQFCRDMRRLCRKTGVKLILGLNLGRGTPAMARRWVREALMRIGAKHILAFEIGNEPDAYVLTHQRKPGYTLTDYEKNFATVANAIAPLLPRPGMIAGPAFSCFWLKQQTAVFIRQMHRYLGLVTIHDYPLGIRRAIPMRTSIRYDSIAHLLDHRSSYIYYSILSKTVAAARQFHLPVRWGEMNSAAGGGDPGISDSFASVLWLTNALFYAAQGGAVGVNLHDAGSALCPYAIFRYNRKDHLVPHPDYDAMLLFAMASCHGARLLSAITLRRRHVKVWATRNRNGTIRLVIVNSRMHRGVRLQVPARGYGLTDVVSVSAPSVVSFEMPTWQNIRPSNASLAGNPRASSLARTSRGELGVSMPQASIYMLTLKRRD